MALTRLDAGNNTTNATTYASGTITPGANRVICAFVANFAGGFGAGAPQPVVTGNGVVWDLVDSVTMGSNGSRRLSCFVARGPAPTAGPVTFTFTAQQDLCAWSIFEYDAVAGDTTAVVTKRSKVVVPNVATLSISPNPSAGQYEVSVGGVLVEAPNQASRVVAAGADCTQIHIQAPTQQFASSATLHTEERVTSGALTWNWNGAANAVAIAFAVTVATAPPQPPPPPDPIEALIAKFEPILFFHRDERSFPSDAKRFVEHCALWQATSPFDDKASWGAAPRVKAGQLSAAANEPGTFLGTEATATGVVAEELFLELDGWIDKSGAGQPSVTTSSAHPYANRAKIQNTYATNASLRESQFWYHAEFFDTDRLKHLADRVRVPDLGATVDSFQNPALLCYYFFFPERQLAVGGANIEAVEAGSHAGQWACMVLLLERASAGDDYGEPTAIGITGSPTVPSTPSMVDDEFRTAMKVVTWNPGQQQPTLTGQHPQLWVSPGTHSLYLDDAVHPVAPFPPGKEPSDNGLADTPYSTPGRDEDVALLILKLSNPIGWIALGLEELFGGTDHLWADFGTNFPAESVAPDGEVGAGGVTLHPSSVTPPATWSKPTPWRCARDLRLDGRRYDYIVDRPSQPWWPSDDGRQGFQGRWGQRVEADPFSRRAGMRFPEFWKMFLLAVEDGRQ
ncbi:hypothetical protein [Mycobacterium sp. IDR2000157661]|uniref:hypothetical protein n=1 Tax=Mycobacterium sp. IDR2000157661 TaxID=2867005 RepID=UPI001EEAE798|nr:hypothetical protein [Mycobacterium sp. IDR2000157661]ULE32796.1 hypothetical protein K3G64_22390 [Mycobacterium sp. IDR2000157661]